MTKAQLTAELCGYRDMCTRIDVLAHRVRQAEKKHELLGAQGIAGAQLRMRPLTGMPVGHGGVYSPTENTAMELMNLAQEEWTPELEAQLTEMQRLDEKKKRLDIMLGGLRERERSVITAHLIDGLRWRETERRFAREHGEELTERALRYIMGQGLERMLATAK